MQTFWQYRSNILLAISGFALGSLVTPLVWNSSNERQFAIREYDQRYEFIRPLLICQTSEEEETREYRTLEKRVQGVIASAVREHKITTASVYFRDLNTGRWMGINELEPYTPASLLKVPIMMAYFKDSEDSPEVLAASYAYDRGEWEADPLIEKPLLVAGHDYTALELIRGMIIQSDNPAMDILQSHVNQSALDETYAALEINTPTSFDDEQYQLSAKKYGLFFRVLYNGTFLNRESSNQALEILAESQFHLGIRAGIPSSITVAHKHGVRGETRDGSHVVDVSDCGIVYDPSSPFLLCVMTRGANAFTSSDIIKNIAETVYRGVITDRR